jgi:hypothetical protein
MGVDDSTERDVSFDSSDLVTKGGTAVACSGEAAVVEAIACNEEKEPVGVVDEGPSSLVEAERIEVVIMAATGYASLDVVIHDQHEHEAQQAADARIEARLIVAHARWEQQHMRRLPVPSARTR